MLCSDINRVGKIYFGKMIVNKEASARYQTEKETLLVCISESEDEIFLYDCISKSIVKLLLRDLISSNFDDSNIELNEMYKYLDENFTRREKHLFLLMVDKFNTRYDNKDNYIDDDKIKDNKTKVRNIKNNKEYIITDVERIDGEVYLEIHRIGKIKGKIREYENLLIKEKDFSNEYIYITDEIKQLEKESSLTNKKINLSWEGNKPEIDVEYRTEKLNVTDEEMYLLLKGEGFNNFKKKCVGMSTDNIKIKTIKSLKSLDGLESELNAADLFPINLKQNDKFRLYPKHGDVSIYTVEKVENNFIYAMYSKDGEIKREKFTPIELFYSISSINDKYLNHFSLFANRELRPLYNNRLLDIKNLKVIDSDKIDNHTECVQAFDTLLPRYISRYELTIFRSLFAGVEEKRLFSEYIENLMVHFSSEYNIEFVPDTKHSVILYKNNLSLVMEKKNIKTADFIVNYFRQDIEKFKIRIPLELIENNEELFTSINSLILF